MGAELTGTGAFTFDNTDKVQAPFDALALSERLGLDHPGEELPSPPGRPS